MRVENLILRAKAPPPVPGGTTSERLQEPSSSCWYLSCLHPLPDACTQLHPLEARGNRRFIRSGSRRTATPDLVLLPTPSPGKVRSLPRRLCLTGFTVQCFADHSPAVTAQALYSSHLQEHHRLGHDLSPSTSSTPSSCRRNSATKVLSRSPRRHAILPPFRPRRRLGSYLRSTRQLVRLPFERPATTATPSAPSTHPIRHRVLRQHGRLDPLGRRRCVRQRWRGRSGFGDPDGWAGGRGRCGERCGRAAAGEAKEEQEADLVQELQKEVRPSAPSSREVRLTALCSQEIVRWEIGERPVSWTDAFDAGNAIVGTLAEVAATATKPVSVSRPLAARHATEQSTNLQINARGTMLSACPQSASFRPQRSGLCLTLCCLSTHRTSTRGVEALELRSQLDRLEGLLGALMGGNEGALRNGDAASNFSVRNLESALCVPVTDF